MTYFKNRLALLEEGCGHSDYWGNVFITCSKETKHFCAKCQAKIQQLLECEKEVRKAIEKQGNFKCGWMDMGTCDRIDKDILLKELGIAGEKDEN